MQRALREAGSLNGAFKGLPSTVMARHRNNSSADRVAFLSDWDDCGAATLRLPLAVGVTGRHLNRLSLSLQLPVPQGSRAGRHADIMFTPARSRVAMNL